MVDTLVRVQFPVQTALEVLSRPQSLSVAECGRVWQHSPVDAALEYRQFGWMIVFETDWLSAGQSGPWLVWLDWLGLVRP
jgi:hypothetical protein